MSARRVGAWVVAAASLVASIASASGPAPTLREIFAAAKDSAAVVAARGDRAVAASAREGASLSPVLNPTLALGGAYGVGVGTPLFDASVTLPVEVADQRGARLAEASTLRAWKGAAVELALARAGADAVLAFGEWTVAGARVEEANDGRAAAAADATALQARLTVGDTTALDVSAAAAEVARWEQLRAEATIARLVAASRVRELTGLDLDASTPTPPSLLPPSPSSAVPARVSLLRTLDDERRYWLASEARWGRERFSPLGFAVVAGRGELGEARIGGSIVWALPFANRSQGEVARARAERSRVEELTHAYERVLEARRAGAHEAFDAALGAVQRLDSDGLPALDRALEAVSAGYRAGKVELSRVLSARRDRALMRARRLDLIATAWRAYAELTDIDGGLP